jgi:DNA polymerase-1
MKIARFMINVSQGSAADVCKAAMIATEKAQQKCTPQPTQAELMLQIHDELVWEVPDHQLEQFKCNKKFYK